MLGIGIVQARALLGRLKPMAVIGFGGYPTIPPVLAAAWSGVPSLIHARQRRHRPRQSFSGAARRCDCHDLPRCLQSRAGPGGEGDADWQSSAAAVVAAAATPYQAPSDTLRLVIFGGSQGARIHGRHRACRHRATRRRAAREACRRPAGARGGCRPRAPGLCEYPRRGGDSAVLPRSARARGGEPSWWCRVRGLERPPSSPRSADLPSWCRCRTRSIRINPRMPACSNGPAAPCGYSRTLLPRSGWPPRSPRWRRRHSGSPQWRRRQNRWAGSIARRPRLADLVLKVRRSAQTSRFATVFRPGATMKLSRDSRPGAICVRHRRHRP